MSGYNGNRGLPVYVDGSCTSNGQPGAAAGYGVYFGPNNPSNVSAPVRGVPATNNNAEIQAATEAINRASSMGHRSVDIHTDSQFLIDSSTKWMPNWKSNDWRTASNQPVKNQTAFKQLDRAMSKMDDVRFTHVPGHSGNPGNEAADRLARQGASQYNRYK